jgi:lipoprotein-anchoring transpeptidase ErfK/SrfK
MSSPRLFCLAASALAAMLVCSASSSAEPLALNDPVSFPGSIFQQVLPQPEAVPDESVTDESNPADTTVLPERLRREIVAYNSSEPPGTIIIDTPHTYLYYVLGGGRAIRYGIGVGRDGFTWAGTQSIARKQEWPDWYPPPEMIARQPYLPRMMSGGPGNPLGARAMYLGNTQYRIHGTNAPGTIGQHVSSGCIRLTNDDIIDLFNRTNLGARVVVLPDNAYRAQRPAPQRVTQRVSVNVASDPPRPAAEVPAATHPTLLYGSQASRLY